jgi:CelD/BcsL family acetyltransferase involved in cellulose biosynthesis
MASLTDINFCPFINLTGHNWESYSQTLGSSHRSNFNRRLNNLVKAPDFRVECARTVEEAGRSLDILVDLHQKRWQSRENESEAFHSGAVRQFHRDFVELAAAQGWLRLHVMWLQERPVAALYGLKHGKTLSFYQSGFDPEFSKQSVGLVMMGLAIKSAVDEGCTEYDFLHGGEEYKFHWARETRPLGRLELFPADVRARLYRRAIDLNRSARRMAKRVLQRA